MTSNMNEFGQDKGKTSPPEAPKSRLALWLLVFSMAVLLISLSLIANTVVDASIDMSHQLDAVNTALAVSPQPNPTELALRGELLGLQGDKGSLEIRVTQLAAEYFNWPSMMLVISAYDESQMQLVSLVQAQTHLNLIGHSGDETIITSYVENLRNSEFFSSVTIQSISLKTVQSSTQRNATPEPTQSYLEFVLSAEIKVGQP